MTYAEGVLPGDVIRDPASSGELWYLTLADNIPLDDLEGIVRTIYETTTQACTGEHPVLAVAVGWGPRLFNRLPAKPTDLAVTVPANATLLDADIALYVMAREESHLADLKRQVCAAGGGHVISIVTHHGYQRPDRRELGGFLDGLRNAPPSDRDRIVFVDRDTAPDEPPAAEGGAYMVSMRILQDLDAWNQLDATTQEHIIGRRKTDGSRLDLPEGTASDAEGEITAGTDLPLDSHIAKAGPRGAARDRVRIFRRGLPFTEFTPDGHCEAGLLFVSFQADMDQFRTIADEWMGNADFPDAGTNTDSLFRDGHATVTTIGAFFVPANHSNYPGEEFFHPVDEDDRCLGYISVRKTLQDSNGSPIHGERGGFTFQLLGPDSQPVGESFTTDSAGRAVSPAVPRGVTYTIREVQARPGFETALDQEVPLEHRRASVSVINKLAPANPNPGYR